MNPKLPKKAIKPKPAPKTAKPDPLAELTADLQRVQADFENFKKRVAAERSELMDNAKRSVLTDLLPALDNFDRAATHLPEHLANDPWAQGMSYVGTQLEQILDDMGVRKFTPTVGDAFDHYKMDALERIASDHPPETVAEVLTPGYQIGDQIVRPASVKVSAGSSEESDEKPDEETTEEDLEGEK